MRSRKNASRVDAVVESADVVLIGGGIMSTTLGSMLSLLEPQWKIVLLEKDSQLAQESSGPWNNAGTGHSGYCELNYMPNPEDATKAAAIARQFAQTREWWAHLARLGLIDPHTFIHTTPHLDVVFGKDDVDYLRQRYLTLRGNTFFRQMEYTEDPAVVRSWAPIVGAGRDDERPIAATRVKDGADVDFGALSRELAQLVTSRSGQVRHGHVVTSLRRSTGGGWTVRGNNRDGAFEFQSRFVFIGAGGNALELLQKARIPEVKGFAVLPVGAAFLRCSNPRVVSEHDSKVYGQAAIGAPPMSVPHLDRRVVDGQQYLMFGPYATFSTKLLKQGKRSDFFRTLKLSNLPVITAAVAQNLSLIRYLVRQLAATKRSKFDELRQYYPGAERGDWELIAAGQRAQLVKPDRRRIGVIHQGTELVCSADGTMAGLLGASPGASTAVPIMTELLERCFPERWRSDWGTVIGDAIPSLNRHPDACQAEESRTKTSAALGLDRG